MAESIGGVVYVKAGGSFITYKDRFFSVNYRALEALSKALRIAVDNGVRMLLGNGGGSFAHPVVDMLRRSDPRLLLVYCQKATRMLNKILVDYLVDNGIPAVSMQTSAIIHDEGGVLRAYAEPVKRLLEIGVIPVVYGECIVSATKTYRVVSTEKVFDALGESIRASRLVLLTDVDGVYTCDPHKCRDAELIRIIDPTNYEEVVGRVSGSRGVDVTGGIRGKIEAMYEYSRKHRVPVYVLSGFNVEDVVKALLGEEVGRGTVIRGY